MILAFGSRRSIGSVLALATSLAGTLVYRFMERRTTTPGPPGSRCDARFGCHGTAIAVRHWAAGGR